MTFRRWKLIAAFAFAAPSFSQLGPTGGAGGVATLPRQLPLSGRTQIDTQGSVPAGDPVAQSPIPLTLAEAVKRGLQFNLSALVSSSGQRAANAEVSTARAQLRPDINGDLRETVQQTNLAAAGLRFSSIPGSSFSFPSIVGPYNYFDLRASLGQSVADLTKLHNYRSSKETSRAAGFSVQDTRELIVLAVTGAYLQVIAAQSRVETARAQVAVAEATHLQAIDRNRSGLNARIDVNRSMVELQTQKQRLNSQGNDLAKQKLSLARLIGLPQSQPIALTDLQPYNAADAPLGLNEAIRLAWEQRPDMKAAAAQLRAAEESRHAANSQYLPSLSLAADYGAIGINPSQAHGTFSVTGTLHVPIFRSGRIEAGVEQANAALSQRKAELDDLRGRVEQDVRNAQLDLDTATEQMKLAESNRQLAAETLEQARDRFRAGVSDTIEVIQAQESVAAAEQDHIGAIYSYQFARAGLARATGSGEKSIRQ